MGVWLFRDEVLLLGAFGLIVLLIAWLVVGRMLSAVRSLISNPSPETRLTLEEDALAYTFGDGASRARLVRSDLIHVWGDADAGLTLVSFGGLVLTIPGRTPCASAVWHWVQPRLVE